MVSERDQYQVAKRKVLAVEHRFPGSRWIGANCLGLVLGLGLATPSAYFFDYAYDVLGLLGSILAILLMGGLLGLPLGSLQALVFRRMVPHFAAWVSASILGMAIGLSLFLGLVFTSNRLDLINLPFSGMVGFGWLNDWSALGNQMRLATTWFILGACLGSALGISQWLVLRSHVPRSSLWVLGVAVSMAIGLVVGAGIQGLVRGVFQDPVSPRPPALPIVIGALLIGIATAGGILGTGTSLIIRRWNWKSS